jgi:hypothetical protein
VDQQDILTLFYCPIFPHLYDCFVQKPSFSRFPEKKLPKDFASSEKGRTFALAFRKNLPVRAAPSSLGHCRAQRFLDLEQVNTEGVKLDL